MKISLFRTTTILLLLTAAASSAHAQFKKPGWVKKAQKTAASASEGVLGGLVPGAVAPSAPSLPSLHIPSVSIPSISIPSLPKFDIGLSPLGIDKSLSQVDMDLNVDLSGLSIGNIQHTVGDIGASLQTVDIDMNSLKEGVGQLNVHNLVNEIEEIDLPSLTKGLKRLDPGQIKVDWEKLRHDIGHGIKVTSDDTVSGLKEFGFETSRVHKINVENGVKGYHHALEQLDGYDKTIFEETFELTADNPNVDILRCRKRDNKIKISVSYVEGTSSVNVEIRDASNDGSSKKYRLDNGRITDDKCHPEIRISLSGDTSARVHVKMRERAGTFEWSHGQESDPDEEKEQSYVAEESNVSQEEIEDMADDYLASASGYWFFVFLKDSGGQGTWFGPYETEDGAEEAVELLVEQELLEFDDEWDVDEVEPTYFHRSPQ